MPATPIVLIADEAYVLGLAPALRSIEQHTQPLPPIYVIDAGIAADSRLKLQQVVDIQWIHVSNIEQAELQRQGLLPAPGQSCDGHVSAACWLKLTLPQLLPSSVSRALYFDCDMLARTSLLPILQLDLGGAPALVTATSETWAHPRSCCQQHATRLETLVNPQWPCCLRNAVQGGCWRR